MFFFFKSPNSADKCIVLPNINNWFGLLDNSYAEINNLYSGQRVTMDLRNINFLRPEGVLMLLMFTLEIYRKTNQKVTIVNVIRILQTYLDRLGFFKFEHINIDKNLLWIGNANPNPDSKALLPITKLTSPEDVVLHSIRFRELLLSWYGNPELHSYCRYAYNIMSELCGNGVDHSQLGEQTGECFCIVQKYKYKDAPEIRLAVGDIGVGIKAHLTGIFGINRFQADSTWIQRALSGVSSRRTGSSGGMGLQGVKAITQDNNSSFVLRSGKGLVHIGKNEVAIDYGQPFAGTQAVINLRPGLKYIC